MNHLRQIGGGDGGRLGLEAGQGMGELLLRGGVGRDGRQRFGNRDACRITGSGRFSAGHMRPGGRSHDGSNRAVAR